MLQEPEVVAKALIQQELEEAQAYSHSPTYRQFSDPGLEVRPVLTYTPVCSVLLPWPCLQLLLLTASLQ